MPTQMSPNISLYGKWTQVNQFTIETKYHWNLKSLIFFFIFGSHFWMAVILKHFKIKWKEMLMLNLGPSIGSTVVEILKLWNISGHYGHFENRFHTNQTFLCRHWGIGKSREQLFIKMAMGSPDKWHQKWYFFP